MSPLAVRTFPDLVASRCPKCDRSFLPVRRRCPGCRADTVETHVPPRGEILTYTVLFVPPEGFTPPVILAIVRLEAGHNIFGEFVDYRMVEKIKIADPVMAFARDGVYEFHPIEKP